MYSRHACTTHALSGSQLGPMVVDASTRRSAGLWAILLAVLLSPAACEPSKGEDTRRVVASQSGCVLGCNAVDGEGSGVSLLAVAQRNIER